MTLFPGVALVTGAASGIGRATAISFALEGCGQIAICDRNLEGLKETEKFMKDVSNNVDILINQVDTTDETQIENMIQVTVGRFGRLDYALNSAGVAGTRARSTEMSAKDFDFVTSINYRGVWLCSRSELAQMVKQEPLPSHDGRQGNRGSIVNVASQLGIVSVHTAPAYCASKAAVISMTKTDAIDYSKDNIRVNCVCPGVIATPMTGDSGFTAALQESINIAPMKRIGTAQEVADCALFLCSSKATFVQGHAFVMDGGYVIN